MNEQEFKDMKQRIKNTVLDTIQFAENVTLPVPIKKITKCIKNCKLVSYSRHMKKYHMSYKEMIEFTESLDACTDYDATTDRYIIYYNDIEKSIVNSNRFRWNIAHELGHIMLNHHKANQKTRIFRSSLSNEEYDRLEIEADHFAAYILVPYSVLYINKVHTLLDLRETCKISGKASSFRFSEYCKWMKNSRFKDDYDRKIAKIFIKEHRCSQCETVFIESDTKYCPICGNNKFYFGGIYKDMIYVGIETDSNNKAIACPRCSNEDVGDGNFCPTCGLYLKNHCSKCSKELSGKFRYCPTCGCESTFKPFMLDWKEEQQHIEETQSPKAEAEIEAQNTPSFSIPSSDDDDLPF